MIKIIGLLSFFYMSNIYAMEDEPLVKNTNNIDAMRHNFSVNNTKSHRASRACLPCRAHKQKCDGIDPCKNCSKNGKVCVYPKFVKRGRKPKYKNDNQKLHDSTMIPSFSLTNPDISNSYKEEGCFYIGDNDLNQKSKKRKQSAKKPKTNNIVYIDITTDDIKLNDIKPDAENNINNSDIESVDSPPYVFGDELGKICDPWIRN